MSICFKCGTSTGMIIKHHLSYDPEILVDCCKKCHRNIHLRVRKENACPYSVKEVQRLSAKSSIKRTTRSIDFYEQVSPYVSLYENITYNLNNGNIYYSSGFSGSKGRQILYLR